MGQHVNSAPINRGAVFMLTTVLGGTDSVQAG